MKHKTTRHHRRPRSLGGSNLKENISKVPQHQHEAWHLLFQNYPPEVIATIVNDIWLDPDYTLIVVRKSKVKAA